MLSLNLTGQQPAHGPISPEPPEEELRAFFAVPFAAAAAWYAFMMLQLLVVNGRLRLRTDLLLIGVGTLILGLPIAAAITLVVALPLYRVVTRIGCVNLAFACLAGVAIGGAASFFAHLMEDPTLMPWWMGPAVGSATSACWWVLAGRPGPRSRSQERPSR